MELFPEDKRRVADFSPEQVQQFVQNWFRAGEQSSEEIAEKIANPQWQQTIEQVVKSQQPADRLLRLIKQSIDWSISSEPRLNQFLTWLLQKVGSVQANYPSLALKACYLTLAGDLALALDRALTGDPDLALDRVLFRTLALACDLDLALTLARTLALDLDLSLALDLSRTLDLSLTRARPCDPKFAAQLGQVRGLLPSLNNWPQYQHWWQVEGQQWLGQLRQVMIQHRNIGHDWQFNHPQKQQLQRYYDANCFLIKLLSIEGAVSQDVRAEIEDGLLLPWSELQRRYPGTYGQADS